jgi:hypothetical protein
MLEAMATPGDLRSELRMDPEALYREETFTDRSIGTIRVLTPVRRDGAPDLGRKVLYVGETQLVTAAGLLPLVFEIDASSLADAIEKFGGAAGEALERTRQELEQLRREASSSIILPDRMPGGMGGLGGPGLGPGGLPGAGPIRRR